MTRLLSSYKMIVLMGLSSALGYSTTAPIWQPVPFVDVSSRPTTDEAFRPSWFVPNVSVVEEQAKPAEKVSYDFGLGKNQPVYGGKRSSHQAKTFDQVTRHMVQYESARTFPSPLVEKKGESQTAAPPPPVSSLPPKKKQQLPKVQLERKAQDVLKIYMQNHNNMESSLPTMFGKHQSVDLNTVWVEMLIHNQQEEEQQQQERHYQQREQQLVMASV
jgi:hypothetical protein